MTLLQRNSYSQSYSSQIQDLTQKISGDDSMWLHSCVGLPAGDIYLSNHVSVMNDLLKQDTQRKIRQICKTDRIRGAQKQLPTQTSLCYASFHAQWTIYALHCSTCCGGDVKTLTSSQWHTLFHLQLTHYTRLGPLHIDAHLCY